MTPPKGYRPLETRFYFLNFNYFDFFYRLKAPGITTRSFGLYKTPLRERRNPHSNPDFIYSLRPPRNPGEGELISPDPVNLKKFTKTLAFCENLLYNILKAFILLSGITDFAERIY